MFIVLVMFVTSSYWNETMAQKIVPTVSVSWEFHRPKKDCKSGFWICKPKGTVTIKFEAKTSQNYQNSEFPLNANFSIVDGYLTITFLTKVSEMEGMEGEDLSFMYADEDEDYELPTEVSEALGHKAIVLQAGKYEVDYGASEFGTVKVKIKN